jgi:hypothetical protein
MPTIRPSQTFMIEASPNWSVRSSPSAAGRAFAEPILVSTVGKRDFARQRQRRRNGPRNPIDSLRRLMRRRIPASSGLFATSREISVCARLRGGAERTRTSQRSRSGLEVAARLSAPLTQHSNRVSTNNQRGDHRGQSAEFANRSAARILDQCDIGWPAPPTCLSNGRGSTRCSVSGLFAASREISVSAACSEH